jgi:hypothetical protein
MADTELPQIKGSLSWKSLRTAHSPLQANRKVRFLPPIPSSLNKGAHCSFLISF